MNEKILNNVIGGGFGLDILISFVCLVGTRTFGHNRNEPLPQSNTDGFVIVGGITKKEGKPLNQEEFHYITK